MSSPDNNQEPAAGDYRLVETNIFDVQASEPYETQSGEKKYRNYVNLRLHVLAPSMERVVELMRRHHPEARLHQIIKRSHVSDVVIDPEVFGVEVADAS